MAKRFSFSPQLKDIRGGNQTELIGDAHNEIMNSSGSYCAPPVSYCVLRFFLFFSPIHPPPLRPKLTGFSPMAQIPSAMQANQARIILSFCTFGNGHCWPCLEHKSGMISFEWLHRYLRMWRITQRESASLGVYRKYMECPFLIVLQNRVCLK